MNLRLTVLDFVVLRALPCLGQVHDRVSLPARLIENETIQVVRPQVALEVENLRGLLATTALHVDVILGEITIRSFGHLLCQPIQSRRLRCCQPG